MSGVLDIERLVATCVGARQEADGLAARVDGALRNRFPDACRRAVSPLLDGPGDEVWLIRRLAVDVGMPGGRLDSDQLAQLLASTAGAAIAETIAAGPEGDRVIRFASRSAYLAELLADLAEGRALDRWYHADARGLAPLPATAAIREALAREPDVAEPALLSLAREGRLERVLSVMSDGDALAALDTCARVVTGASAAAPEQIRAIARAWPAAQLSRNGPLAAAPNALRLYLAVRSEAPHVAPSQDLLLAALALGDVARSDPDPPAAVRAIARADLTEIKHMAARFMPAALPLLAAIAEAVEEAPSALEPLAEAVRSDGPAAKRGDVAMETLFGAAFLLLAYAPWLREAADPVSRFIPLAKALAGEGMAAAAADPAMRLAVGAKEDTELPSALTPEEDAACSMEAERVLRAFAGRLVGFGDSSAEFLNEQFLQGLSTVRARDGRIEVELPRVPLDVILRMAGVHGATYELPWAGKVRLALPEG
jgi:hypothetical protein